MDVVRQAWVLAALAAAAALCAPEAARAEAALRLSASPASLVLGKDDGAELVLEGPADLVPPQLSTNVGTIEELKPAGPGRFQARYRPPTKRFPQVAIVAAVCGESAAFVALPLFGQGEAVIHTKPAAHIDAVRIGEQTFGPAVADAAGVALVPVVVPPGIAKAYHGSHAIDLGLPEVVHLHCALDLPAVPADQPARVNAWCFAVSADGSRRRSPRVLFTASAGSVHPAGEDSKGVLRASWELAPGPAEDAQLSVHLEDEPSFVRVIHLARVAGRPARVTLETDRLKVLSGETSLSVRVLAQDSAGNAIRAPLARVETSFGQAEPVQPAGPAWATRISLPTAFDGHQELALKAVGATGEILAQASVPLVAGEPRLSIAPTEISLARGTAIVVSAKDRFGNAAAGTEAPRARVALGTAALRPSGPGEWLVDYRPPPTPAQSDTLVVQLGTQEARRRIELIEAPRRLEASAKVGAIGNGSLAGAWLALECGWRFDLKGQPLVLALETSWYRFSNDEKLDTGEDLSGTHDFLSGLVSVTWRHPFGRGDHWIFNLGLGVGGSVVLSSLRLGDQPAEQDRGSGFSYEATVGVTRALFHGGPFLELRYWRHSNLGISNLKGQLGVLLLDLGYRYEAL